MHAAPQQLLYAMVCHKTGTPVGCGVGYPGPVCAMGRQEDNNAYPTTCTNRESTSNVRVGNWVNPTKAKPKHENTSNWAGVQVQRLGSKRGRNLWCGKVVAAVGLGRR